MELGESSVGLNKALHLQTYGTNSKYHFPLLRYSFSLSVSSMLWNVTSNELRRKDVCGYALNTMKATMVKGLNCSTTRLVYIRKWFLGQVKDVRKIYGIICW